MRKTSNISPCSSKRWIWSLVFLFFVLFAYALPGHTAPRLPLNVSYTVPAVPFTAGNGFPPFGEELGGYFSASFYQPPPVNGIPQQPIGSITTASLSTSAAPAFNPTFLPQGYPASNYTAIGSNIRLYSNDVNVSPWPASAQFDFYDSRTGVVMVINIENFDPRSASNPIFYIQEIYEGFLRTASDLSVAIEPCTTAKPCRPPCGDERDQIIGQYSDYGVNFLPTCDTFTESAANQYYSFSALNTGDFSWALLRQPLITEESSYGLLAWANAIGTVRTINSAYRNPARNANVGGRPQSRHVFGDAVDLQNVSRTYREYLAAKQAANTVEADYIEPFNGPCKNGCIHADWRLHLGPYSP